jgi:muconolactone delta-isomerase
MRYLIDMRLRHFPSTMAREEGIAFVEEGIAPTLDALMAMEQQGTVVAGGPVSGSIALAFIVDVDSQAALDGVFAALPIWPRMETSVRPLTTFAARKASVQQMVARLREG